MVATTVKSRSDDRRQHILEVAGEVFVQEGYAAASMSAIAAKLGGSKGTLYNYFTSKMELFAAYMSDACVANSEALLATSDDETPLDEALRRLGVGFLEFVLRNESMAVSRLVIAEAHRFPELGEAFYETGPKQSVAFLADWMKRRMDRGEMRETDPETAARQFFALCKSGLYMLRMWNVVPDVTRAEIERHIADQVEMFVAAYGVG
jgi:TetR/AcrR family transcriptional repressor of mexJK operon